MRASLVLTALTAVGAFTSYTRPPPNRSIPTYSTKGVDDQERLIKKQQKLQRKANKLQSLNLIKESTQS